MRQLGQKNLILSLIWVVLLPFCQKSETNTPSKKTDIIVLHAGSLSIPFKDMAIAFMQKYPEFKILLEGYGSRTCARQITDLKRKVDVMASADSSVIRNLLIPKYADFCIDFSANEMVVMYSQASQFADSINSQNWYKILLKPDVQYGHSDPNSDPCGYRTLLTWQLAEKHYKVNNLYQRLRQKMAKKNIRAKEVDLIALLESGELDYIFIYRSVAQQHKSSFIILPDEINLKSIDKNNLYQTAKLKITGKTPGDWIQIRGASMVYGLTIPKNAPHLQAGIKFISFILGDEGRRIMEKNGQPELTPPTIDNKDKLPDLLKHFFNNET